MKIIKNCRVRVTRKDVVIYPSLDAQIEFSDNIGSRGELNGLLVCNVNTDLRSQDRIQILWMKRVNVLPPIINFTVGPANTHGYPLAHVAAPIFGGVRQGLSN